MIILLIFIPPAVEPAQAPVNSKTRSTEWQSIGQFINSTPPKPVVEITAAH